MISFDHNGNLIPYTRIPLNLSEVYTFFVTAFPESNRRATFYNRFQDYTDELNQMLDKPVQQWLGGSFISSKLNPNDIDCVNLIEFNENREQNVDLLIPYLLIGGSRDNYFVDGHLIAVYPTDDERFATITAPSLAYWEAFLMKDRQDNPRGIVELTDLN